MRLLAIAVALLGLLVACDSGSASFGLDTSAIPLDSGLPTTNEPELRKDAMGTQVGSEGFWGCPILSAEPLTDRVSDLPAIGGSPVVLAAGRMGPWSLDILDTDAPGPVPGSLLVADGGDYLWIDVEEGPDCYDHLLVSVLGTLGREGSGIEALSGSLAIREGASRLIITSDAPLSVTSESWGLPSAAVSVTFRIDAALDEIALDGEALYVDCPRNEVSCPTGELVASVQGSR